ncbi:MAG TPA: DoxX family protein [Albidovulum sp.]|uniref:DoxX family protein n=1 Tax=Albidovulum sp. TaxID=1872424 RepID=UPI002B78F422|nr:DoxX family protein [Albidovulum sp.]
MSQLTSSATLLARILISILFIISGYGKLGDVAGFTGYMTSGGVPAIFAWPTIALEFLGGLAILVGAFTRPVALALAGFSLLSALMFHFVPADQMQMIMFMKNLAIAGGLLLLAAQGAGVYSVDALLGRKSASLA